MNWLIFIITAYVATVLETGLRSLWGIPDGTGVTPSLLLIVGVYVGLMAPSSVVPWAMLLLGVLHDLQLGPVPETVIIGPGALGYLLGAYAVLQLRPLMFRESVITLAVMVFTVGVFVQLMIVALYTVRGLPWPVAEPVPGWSASSELAWRFMALIYSAALSVPVGLLLMRSWPIWGFASRGRGDRHH